MKRLRKYLIALTIVVMMASGCGTLKTSRSCPELVLDYGWSDVVPCSVAGKQTQCKCMTVEDIEKLRRWIIFMQENVCK